MKIFKDFTNSKEDFDLFREKVLQDDEKVLNILEGYSHKEFMSAIMQLGTLIDLITDYLEFLKPQIDESMNLSEKTRNRKLNKIAKDLNTLVNTESGFNGDTYIVEDLVLYEGELFIFIDKAQFLRTIEFKKLAL